MKVNVNLELCCGNGLCAVNCPQVFKVENEKVVLKMNEIPTDLQDSCEMTAFACPTNAISIET